MTALPGSPPNIAPPTLASAPDESPVGHPYRGAAPIPERSPSPHFVAPRARIPFRAIALLALCWVTGDETEVIDVGWRRTLNEARRFLGLRTFGEQAP